MSDNEQNGSNAVRRLVPAPQLKMWKDKLRAASHALRSSCGPEVFWDPTVHAVQIIEDLVLLSTEPVVGTGPDAASDAERDKILAELGARDRDRRALAEWRLAKVAEVFGGLKESGEGPSEPIVQEKAKAPEVTNYEECSKDSVSAMLLRAAHHHARNNDERAVQFVYAYLALTGK
jgi:hypothetical protein